MLDITQPKQLEDELRQLATTDALTGLCNRPHFLRLAEQEMARFNRAGNPASVLMLDLDYFKHINDTYGHGVGDAVLRDFSRRTGILLRQVDLFGRIGGEEFCILSPDTDRDGGPGPGPAPVPGHRRPAGPLQRPLHCLYGQRRRHRLPGQATRISMRCWPGPTAPVPGQAPRSQPGGQM